MTRWYDRDGRVITMEQGATLFETPSARLVARAKLPNGVEVSTVHLVIDHQRGDGPPLIFETIVFGGEHDQWVRQYSTEPDADAGHAATVAWLNGEGPEPSGGQDG